jgi:HEPN domain-containing protein
MAKIDFLKKRADEFSDLAKWAFKEKYYNLAAFNLEQASQLYLKYYFGLRARKYPKTHSLEELLEGIGKIYEREKEVKKLLEENASVIGDLEQAYLTSRYLPVEFSKKRIENMFEFFEKLIDFLKKL